MPFEGFSTDYDVYTKRLVVNSPYSQGFEDYAPTMGAIVVKLMEIKTPPKIVVVEEAREYYYSDEEASMLLEVAKMLLEINKQNLVSIKNVLKGSYCDYYLPKSFGRVSSIVETAKYDPVLAYRRLVREVRMIQHKMKKIKEGREIEELKEGGDKNACRVCFTYYMHKVLLPLRQLFEDTAMIQKAKEMRMQGRQIYHKLFRPSTRPTFMYTRLETSFPENAELVDRYKVRDATVSIFRIEGRTDRLYHLSAEEFSMNYEEYEILEKARRYIGAHEPSEVDLAEPDLFRKNMFNLAVDLIRDIVETENKDFTEKEIQKLADLLGRYSEGIGLIARMLAD